MVIKYLIVILQIAIQLCQQFYEPIYNMPGSQFLSNHFGTVNNGYGYINPCFIEDVNNDGKADQICTSSQERGVWVQLSQGKTLGPKQQWYSQWDSVSGWTDTNSKPRFVADVDGDGFLDYVGFGTSGVYVAFSDGTGFKVRDSNILLLSNYGTTHGYDNFDVIPKLVGDVDGDGKADIVVFDVNGVYVSTSTGTGFNTAVKWIDQYNDAKGWPSFDSKPRFLADIDGDGKKDIVGFGVSDVYVSFSTGSSFEAPVFLSKEFPNSEFSSQLYKPRILRDVDGDGKADIIGISFDKIWISLSDGRNNFKPRYLFQSGISFTQNGTWSKQHFRFVSDVDGDGVADFIGFSNSGTHVSFVTKTCSHVTRLPENDCVCQGDYYETGVAQCSALPTNCGQFAHMSGDGRKLHLFMDDNKIPMVPTSSTGRFNGIWVIVINKLDGSYYHIKNFDVEGDVDEVAKLDSYFKDTLPGNTNVIVANYGVVTTNLITSISSSLISKGDMTGGNIVSLENFGLICRWNTMVGFPHNQHRVVDQFMYTSNCIIECRQQCNTCNKGVDNCLTCAPNRERPPTCGCKAGYYEIPWVGECVKISQNCAVTLTAISLGGYNLRAGQNYGNYINNERSPSDSSGLPETTGLYITLVDELGQLSDEKYFHTHAHVAQVNEMIAFINNLPQGQKVLVNSATDATMSMTADGWAALGTLGLDVSFTYAYTCAISMIGVKGAAQGSVPQQYTPNADPGLVMAVSQECLYNCIYKCSNCEKSIDQCTSCSHSTRIDQPNCNCKDGFYDDGINAECQELPSNCGTYAQVHSGKNYLYMYLNGKQIELKNTSTTGRKQGIYVVSYDYNTFIQNQNESFDIGGSQAEADRLEDFIKNTLKHPDLILVGSLGDVSTYLKDTLLSTMTTYWKFPSGKILNRNERFAYIAKQRSAVNFYLTQQITTDFAKAETCVQECASKCNGNCSNGYENCLSCGDNRKTAPLCECQDGFYSVGERTDCLPEYSTCSQTASLISYGGYDIKPGKNFGIYFNDLRHTFSNVNESSRYFFIIQIDNDGSVKDSAAYINFGGSANIDPGLKNYIQSIENGTKVYHITNGDAYTNRGQIIPELESLGYDSTVPMTSSYYMYSFAMIGQKGLTTGQASQQKWQEVLRPNYSFVRLTECIRGCEYMCQTCYGKGQGSMTQCGTCSHSTRGNAPTCGCLDTYYDDGLDNAECKSCVHPCVNCSNQNTCTSCVVQTGRATTHPCLCEKGYYENSSKVCTICPYPCAECDDQAVCTKCKNDANRLPAFPECECDVKFFDNSSACQDCNYKCDDCSGNADNCGNCSHPTRGNAPTCGCLDTYYDDGLDNAECKSCVHPCVNCSNQNTCTSCVVQTGRATTHPCLCEKGYYENSSKVCTICPYPCAECDDQAVCTKCKNDANRLPAFPECECDVKFFDNGSACQDCNYKCDDCSGNADNCGNCSHPTRGNAPTCGCLDTYYDDGLDNAECKSCVHPCINCSNQNTCTSCVVQTGRATTHPCLCEATYYENSSKVCTKCPYNCNQCDDENNCTSCPGGQNRSDNIPKCECLPGFFDSQQQDINCLECQHPCDTCSSLNVCLTCVSDPNRSNSAPCSCNSGYFNNDQNICQKCIYPCDNCSSLIICETCSTLPNRKDQSSCQCQAGFYDNDSECLQCNLSLCVTCTGSPDNCSNCYDETRDFDNDCQCIQGYYDNGNPSCQQCSKKCKLCENNSDECIECSNSLRQQADCDCIDGYYSNDLTGDCIKCSLDCKCNQNDICIDCFGDDKNFRSLPKCTCKSGYFNNQENICQSCENQCQMCQEEANNCFICKRGQFRSMQSPTCGCQEGYYEIEGSLDCQLCPSNCKKCNKKGVCTECINNQFTIPLCKNTDKSFSVNIEDSNLPGSSDGNNNGNNSSNGLEVIVSQCKIQCSSCQNSSNNCLTCQSSLNRQNNPPQCNCQQGYHDNENTTQDCFKCSGLCKTCISHVKCLSCHQNLNRQIDPVTLQCKCIQGYTESKTNENECVSCYKYRGECFQQCPKNTFQDEQLKQCNDTELIQISNTQIIFICLGALIFFQVSLFVCFQLCTNKNIKKLGQKQFNKVSQNPVQASQDQKSSSEEA